MLGIRTGMLPHTRYSLNQFPVRTFKEVQRSQAEQHTGSNIPMTWTHWHWHVLGPTATLGCYLCSSKLRVGAAAEQVI